VGNLEHVEDKENAFRILLGKAKEKSRSENLGIEGRDVEVTCKISDARVYFRDVIRSYCSL
jgi:hypothetical protein